MLFGFEITELIQVLGYPGIFAVILAESGLFFAASLPGGSLLFTAGLLASEGFLNIWILLAIVIVAAVLGDSIGYWFGSWVGPALWRRKDTRFFKKAYLEQTRMFFDEHGSKTIVLARFVPIVRTFAPILAGVANMHYRTFFIYNTIGAVLWGGGFVMAGYLLGEVVPDIESHLELIVLGIVFVTMIPLLFQILKARKTKTTHGNPQVLLFDLDDTLADSFTPPTAEMLKRIETLAQHVPVAIVSGATLERVRADVLSRLRPDGDVKGLYAFTDNAAQCWQWLNSDWRETYAYPLGPADAETIAQAIREAIEESGIFESETNQSAIQVRPSSVAFHALPTTASQLDKRAWDSDGAKRTRLAEILRNKLPEYEVMVAGKTSVDVTRKGITKAHGVNWLAKNLGIEPRDMLFVGDSFYTGGNDAVVIPTGVRILETKGPTETATIIDDLLAKYR